MSFPKSKRSDIVAVEGKENMPLVDPSSPPPMTEEEDACPPSNIAQHLPSEPDMEVDGDEYSDSDPHSDDTSPPEEDASYQSSSQERFTVQLDNDLETIDDADEERYYTQRPIAIPVEQDRDTDGRQDNAFLSSYDDTPEEGLSSSYHDDPSQESRSRSSTPTPSTPRLRPLDEDTEMPLSSPIREENPTWNSSQESTASMSSVSEGDDNPTSMAYLAEGHDFNAEVEGDGDGGGRRPSLGDDDDAPVARFSQESIRTDYSHERLSSPSLQVEESQPSQDSPSSQPYHEWLSSLVSSQNSSHNDSQDDTTPRSSSSSSSDNGYETDNEMDPPRTLMTSEAGRRSPTSSEPIDWDDDNEDPAETRRQLRSWFGGSMSEDRLEENLRTRDWRRSRGADEEDVHPSSD